MLHLHFQEAGFGGKDTRSKRLLVPKVKPPALLTVHSGVRFPRSVSYNFDLSVLLSKCLLRTSHVQGNEERDLGFNEPTIQRGTHRRVT